MSELEGMAILQVNAEEWIKLKLFAELCRFLKDGILIEENQPKRSRRWK